MSECRKISAEEIAFIYGIDCNFPYEDEAAWKSLVLQGAALSDNAAFMVLHEICRAPSSVPTTLCYKMLEFWMAHYSHPLNSIVLEAGRTFIDKTYLPPSVVLGYMEQIKTHWGLHNALALVYCACDIDEEVDAAEKVEEKHKEILEYWEHLCPNAVPAEVFKIYEE